MSFITQDLNLIIQRLQQGEIAAIPTETVYGLAADATNPTAIAKIFALKQRPTTHPLIMHVCADWDLTPWVEELPEQAQQLIQKYWPGPLSLVFKANVANICPLIRANQTTVAIRAPKHALTQTLLKKLGRPLVAPSANPFEKLSPTTAEHVLKHFPKQNLAILDGGRCQLGIESTIIDMAIQPGRILRPGQLKLGQSCQAPIDIQVPGQYLRHYQPQKPCFYFEDETNLPQDAYIMSFQSLIHRQVNYQFPDDLAGIYYEFYYQLQQADETKASCILIQLPKPDERYTVIQERILKAAQKLNSFGQQQVP